MSYEAPETHVQIIPGTADFAARPGAAELGVETATHNLVFRANGATRKAIDNFSDQTVAGAKTMSGTLGVRVPVTVTTDATATLTSADTGKVYICTASSGTQVFSLPAASTGGLMFTFVCGHASGEIRVGVVTTGDNIIGKTHGAQDGTGISTTATTGLLLNTAATNVIGDFVTLVSDGLTSYYMVAVAGAWSAA